MKSDDPAAKLSQLHQASERISANLVELELDSSRQLLEATSLTGESAAAWSSASAALTELWRRHGLLEVLLARADKARRADERRSLLDGRSIELSSNTVPLAQRALLDSPQESERCSPEELLAAMSSAFDQVKTVIASIGATWNTLIPTLDRARRLLGAAARLAAELNESDRADLLAASRRLDQLAATLTTDPMSVAEHDVDELARTVQSIRDDLEEGVVLKRSFETRILEARELLERLRTAAREAVAARHELLLKISTTAPPAPADPSRELGDELSEIGELGAHGAWPQARRSLQDWTARTEAQLERARRSRQAARAPIEARNQFRALLDAYQVKAKNLGLLEDPELQEIALEAQDVLYTAPTDLALAAQLVRRYQQSVNGSSPVPEVRR